MSELENDRLFGLLKDGKATVSDQKEAARWIEWLDQFVPPEAAADRRDGYVTIPYEKARR